MSEENKELMKDLASNPPELLPTPEEVEKVMVEREKMAHKALDGYAQFFTLYIHRFREQLKMMSKKQLLTLCSSLSGSQYNKSLDLKRLLKVGQNMNLNSLIRTIGNVVENPLNEEEFKTFNDREREFFILLENLLTEKYIASIENVKEVREGFTIQDIIQHSFTEKDFNKRSVLEKDAFSTANQLLFGKYSMMHYTVLEELTKKEGEKSEQT